MQRGEFARAQAKDASRLKVAVVAASFNADITDSMLEGALAALHESRVAEKNITIVRVPGSFEIPFACEKVIRAKKPDAVVAIGCVLRGETDHDKYIAHAVASGLTEISVRHRIPVAFGVITPNTLAQAQKRSRGRENHARFAAIAAITAALDTRGL
jgi:6,7-dimethyl-8-ribityllumazine synthase